MFNGVFYVQDGKNYRGKFGNGNHHSNTKNLRRINVLVTSQTAYNLDRLAGMCGYKNAGRVIDKLVREKMMELNEYRRRRD
jgi:hypothetical protein